MGRFDNELRAAYIFDENSGCWIKAGAERFNYTDGDQVENHIVSVIKQAKDIGSASFELGESCIDWPTTYHLSAKRSSLLRPFQSFLHGRILEVGAGMGAVTRILGESKADVLALEGSFLRASAIHARCRDLPNVTVLAESFHQFNAVQEFDVIVLVGVLEYARKFFDLGSGDPVDRMLQYARSLLRPGGILILAIENQLGLKYFAGAAEDHVGIPMYGVEDLYDKDTVVTFGQKELMERLASSGFPAQNWWFPFPDYKLPIAVLSTNIQDYDVDLSPLLAHSVGADMQIRGGKYFSLEQAWQVIARNKLVPALANSFLVLASDSERSVFPDERKILGYYYSMNRRSEYMKEMIFEDTGNKHITIKKRALFPQLPPVEEKSISMELRDEEFIDGKNWQIQLFRILNRPGWSVNDVVSWAQVWYDAMLGVSHLLEEKKNLSAGSLLPGTMLDAIPRNLMVASDHVVQFFDQEWHFNKDIELGYLLFRGVYLELASITNVALPAENTPLNIFTIFRSVALSLGVQIDQQDLMRYADLEREILELAAGLKNWHTTEGLMKLSLTTRGSSLIPSMHKRPSMLERIFRKILSRPVSFLRRIFS